MLLLILSFSITILSSLILLSSFQPRSKIAAILGWYILGFSQIVLVEETAHFFNSLNNPLSILLIQCMVLVGAIGIWLVRKRPVIKGLFFTGRSSSQRLEFWGSLKGHLEIVVLTVVVGFGYLYSFFLGWMIAPNTYDAITTHAVRVVFWLQHGNLSPWNAIRYTQVSYPLNAQLQLLWSAQFLHSDQLFFTVQWLGALVTILCVFGLARLLKYTRTQSLFASLVFACFPLIWMQSSTAQNDLVAAAVFLPVFYFFFLGITQRQTSMLILSGIALGLSLGTKQTLFFYLPGLGLLAALVWLKYRGAITKYILRWAAACLIGFVLFGSFIYLQNFANFGHPLAPPDAIDSAVGGTVPDAAFGNITYNSLRLLYQSIDNSGLPDGAGDFLSRAKNKSIGAVLRFLNPDLESDHFSAATHRFNYRTPNLLGEDSSWFGPVGGILLLPLALYQFVQSIRKKDPWRSGFVVTAFLFWLLDAWLRPGWDPYQGRYFIPAAGLLAPFLAGFVKPGWIIRSVTAAIMAVSIFVLGYTAIFNPGKSPIPQMDDAWAVNENLSQMFKLDWIDEVTLQSAAMANMARLVDENVPPGAVIGWYGFDAPEYPVFGEHFGRKLIPVYPYELIQDRAWLAEQQLEYILVDWDRLVGLTPVDYKEKASIFNWLLLVRK